MQCKGLVSFSQHSPKINHLNLYSPKNCHFWTTLPKRIINCIYTTPFWGEIFCPPWPPPHHPHFSTFFKQFQLLPPDCLPESPVSIDSEYFIQIKIEALLVFFAVKVYLNNKLHHLADFWWFWMSPWPIICSHSVLVSDNKGKASRSDPF